MKRVKALGVLLIGCVLLSSGCAFTPQSVVLKPEVAPASVAVSQGQPVLLTVVDERPRSTLGTRGAMGVGAELTVAGELTEAVRKAITEGLQSKGFTLVTEKPADGRELRVEIRNLDYRVVVGFWVGTLNAECGLKAVCILGPDRPFEQLYRGEVQDSVMVVQTAEANEKYINAAVSKAVNSLLQDPKLAEALAR